MVLKESDVIKDIILSDNVVMWFCSKEDYFPYRINKVIGQQGGEGVTIPELAELLARLGTKTYLKRPDMLLSLLSKHEKFYIIDYYKGNSCIRAQSDHAILKRAGLIRKKTQHQAEFRIPYESLATDSSFKRAIFRELFQISQSQRKKGKVTGHLSRYSLSLLAKQLFISKGAASEYTKNLGKTKKFQVVSKDVSGPIARMAAETLRNNDAFVQVTSKPDKKYDVSVCRGVELNNPAPKKFSPGHGVKFPARPEYKNDLILKEDDIINTTGTHTTGTKEKTFYGKNVYMDSIGRETVWIAYTSPDGSYTKERVLLTDYRSSYQNIESPLIDDISDH